MATFNATSSGPDYTLQLTVNEDSTSVSDNTSTLSWSLDLINRSSSHFDGYGITSNATIGGYTVLNKYASYGNSIGSTINLGSGTMTVTHDADGSKTIGVSFSVSMTKAYYTPGNMSDADSMTLTTIPRATIAALSKSTFALGESITISLPRASPSFTHTVTYIFMNLQNQVTGISPTYTNVGTSCTFTPPYSLASQIPNARSGTGVIYVQTFSGGTHIGDKTTPFTVTVPDTLAPIVSTGWVGVVPGSANSVANGWGIYVQGYSYGTVAFNTSKITPQYGANIVSYNITCNGATVSAAPYRTPVFSASGTNIITCTVTDSRGFLYSGPLPVNVEPYARPFLSPPACYRCTPGGVASDGETNLYIKATGNFSSCAGNNSQTITATLKKIDGTQVDNTITLTSGNGEVLFTGKVLATSSFLLTFSISDLLNAGPDTTVTIQTAEVAFNIRDRGKGAAFGKYAEKDNTLELDPDWDLKMGGVVQPYLVESGTSGIWNYRKWSDGTAECWGTSTASVAIQTAQQYTYVSDCATVDFPSGLFGAIDYVNVIASVASDVSIFHCIPQDWKITISHLVFRFASNVSWPQNNWHYFARVIGRWK